MLPRERRMRNGIREGDPRGGRDDLDRGLPDRTLVGRVELHRVVNLRHVVVVFRPRLLGQAHPVHELRAARKRPADAWEETPGHLLERLAQPPYTRATDRVNVAEHPNDPLAIDRGAG